MNRNRSRRVMRQRERRRCRILMAVFALVLIGGLFAQVMMVSRLSDQAKAGKRLEFEIAELNANADNLILSLNQFRSPERVVAQAVRLGMEKPRQDQLRIVSLPNYIANTSAQSAENIGAEEMQ